MKEVSLLVKVTNSTQDSSLTVNVLVLTNALCLPNRRNYRRRRFLCRAGFFYGAIYKIFK